MKILIRILTLFWIVFIGVNHPVYAKKKKPKHSKIVSSRYNKKHKTTKKSHHKSSGKKAKHKPRKIYANNHPKPRDPLAHPVYAFQGDSTSDWITLYSNGKSDFDIVCDAEDTSSEKMAELFQTEITKSGNTQLPIMSDVYPGKHHVFIQINYSSLQGLSVFSLGENGFYIGERLGDIYIVSRAEKGMEFAIRYFMEQYAKCAYYTYDAFSRPFIPSLKIQIKQEIQIPAFSYREVYIGEAFRPGYASWNKLNQNAEGDFRNHPGWGLWVHTMHRLLSPELYFKTHPEYFALRNGKRLPDQLCLSQPDVLEITIASLQKEMEKNPDALYWSVSQMDNYNYCECDKCHQIDSIEESHSGSLIQFINQVAKAFPAKIISTLAYQYSRKAPKNTRPRINVNIMLCTIECNRAKPIESDTSQGSFYNDLKDWSLFTHNILIWDYVTNFRHLVLPYPNWQVLQSNLQFFHRFGVRMIFEQGFSKISGEMQPLRAYLLAKWCWNPNYNSDSLINVFLQAYYGKAANYVLDYIRAQTQNLNASKQNLNLYEPPSVYKKGYLSPNALKQYENILLQAKQVVQNDSVLSHRVDMIFQSLRYAKIEISKACMKSPDGCYEWDKNGNPTVKKEIQECLNLFCKNNKLFGPVMLHEAGQSPENYCINTQNYFDSAYVKHKLISKPVTFSQNPDKAYALEGPGCINDGFCGPNEYHSFWQGWWGKDLEAVFELNGGDTLQTFRFRFLDDNEAWIMAPSKVIIYVSNDGKKFKQLTQYLNPNAGQKMNKHIEDWEIKLDKAQYFKYLKIKAENIGKLPVWRGVDGNSWLFCDEIIAN